MKTQVIQDPPPPAPAGTVTAGPPARPRGGGVTALVLGGIGVVVALALMVSGAAVVLARSHDGYYTSDPHRISTSSRALVSDRLRVDADTPDWVLGERFATSRISARSDQPVFVGIGRTAAVERYLADVRHAVITDVDTSPFRLTSHVVGGGSPPAAPADRRFWRVQSSGAGTRTVTWPVERGDWSVVVMNADGSPGVDVRTSFGVRIPSAQWIGAGLLIVGLLSLAGSALLLLAGIRRRRRFV